MREDDKSGIDERERERRREEENTDGKRQMRTRGQGTMGARRKRGIHLRLEAPLFGEGLEAAKGGVSGRVIPHGNEDFEDGRVALCFGHRGGSKVDQGGG